MTNLHAADSRQQRGGSGVPPHSLIRDHVYVQIVSIRKEQLRMVGTSLFGTPPLVGYALLSKHLDSDSKAEITYLLEKHLHMRHTHTYQLSTEC